MQFRQKQFKIFMILLFTLLFVVQIYYSFCLFVGGLDMATAVSENKLNLVFESHDWLLTSRLVISLMQSHSLNLNVLSAFMVFFLILSSLNWIDIVYFGLMLISLFYAIQSKKISIIFSTLCAFVRLIFFIVLVISGGVLILNVFLVGNTSVLEVVELGSTILPVLSIIFGILSILSYVFSIKLEFRKS